MVQARLVTGDAESSSFPRANDGFERQRSRFSHQVRERGGVHLAEAQGGLAKVPLAVRLQLLIDVANSVAAAHGIGVLHKDIKPANILIVPAKSAFGWQVKIADFGSASLFDPSRLAALGITNLGFSQTLSPREIQLGLRLVF